MFVTMFFGILDRRSGRLSFASAGHNPLIMVNGSTGKVQLIKTKGFPLGMVNSAMYYKRMESGQITMSENDWLIQYTDGINEAQNSAGEEFGLERLSRLIESHRGLGARELVSQLLKEHGSFVGDAPQFDDITMLAIKWLGQPADTKTERMEESASVC